VAARQAAIEFVESPQADVLDFVSLDILVVPQEYGIVVVLKRGGAMFFEKRAGGWERQDLPVMKPRAVLSRTKSKPVKVTCPYKEGCAPGSGDSREAAGLGGPDSRYSH
jgi:hypothetical protein